MTFADIRWGLLLAGLGLFLFGIELMGDGLKSFAGDKLRDYIDKYTSNSIMAVFVGAIMTALVQSSGATTVITISFVRAGLMTLEQAAGIIIGANIGTTFTVFLIGLNIGEFSVYLILFGALLLRFFASKKYQDLGHILIGFGLLFFGIRLMSSTLAPLAQIPEVATFATACAKNNLIGLLGGIILTIAMQSSAGAIGVIQIIYVTGAISFKALIPFLFGSNIGTCVTALIASLGGNVPSKRAAFIHLLFNIFGSIIGMLCLSPLDTLMFNLTQSYGISPMMQIAIVHILFNLSTAIVLIPFIKAFCNLVRKIIAGEEPKKIKVNIEDLKVEKFPVPATALNVAQHSLLELEQIVLTNVKNAQNYLFNSKAKNDDFENIYQNEVLINKIVGVLISFLTSIPSEHMSEDAVRISGLYLEVANNLERIGDLAMNIGEFGKLVHEDKGDFSSKAQEEMEEMFACFYIMYQQCTAYLQSKDLPLYSQLMVKEAEMDSLEYHYRKHHFQRLSEKTCNSHIASSIYTDILATLERMGDHCCNICRSSFETYNHQ